MPGMSWLEAFGYLASVLVAVSLTMASILRLRIVNLAGAVCFTIYGALTGAYPVALVNFVIILINVYRLWEIFSVREYFQLLEVPAHSEYLQAFLRFHAADIQRFSPGFEYRPGDGQVTIFVLRNMVPAGVFVALPQGADTLRVQLDFVIAGYRDFKVAPFLFREQAEAFRARGIRRLCSDGGHPEHAAYLRRIGFTPDPGSGLYWLELAPKVLDRR
jgi:hypothetical protein